VGGVRSTEKRRNPQKDRFKQEEGSNEQKAIKMVLGGGGSGIQLGLKSGDPNRRKTALLGVAGVHQGEKDENQDGLLGTIQKIKRINSIKKVTERLMVKSNNREKGL